MIVCAADVRRGQLSPSLGVGAVRATGAGGQWTARASGAEGNIYGSMHPISPLQILVYSWNISHKVPHHHYPLQTFVEHVPLSFHELAAPSTSNMSPKAPWLVRTTAPPPKQKGRSKRPMLIPRLSSSSALAKAQGLPVASPQSSQALQCALQVRLPPQRPSPAHTPR